MSLKLPDLIASKLSQTAFLPFMSIFIFAALSLGLNTLAISTVSASPTTGRPTSASDPSSSSGSSSASSIPRNNIDPAAQPDSPKCTNDRCDFIKKYVNPFINLLSVTFGIVAVISLILGGVQYSASEGDPQKVSQAKKRIVNTVLAVVLYFFLFGFLQFLVPGGIFNRAQP